MKDRNNGEDNYERREHSAREEHTCFGENYHTEEDHERTRKFINEIREKQGLNRLEEIAGFREELEGEVNSSEGYRSPEVIIENISEKLLTNDNFNPEEVGKILSESVRGNMNLAKKAKLLERLREEGVNVPEYRGREVEGVYSLVIGGLASICERHTGEDPLESNKECYVEKQTYLFDEL